MHSGHEIGLWGQPSAIDRRQPTTSAFLCQTGVPVESGNERYEQNMFINTLLNPLTVTVKSCYFHHKLFSSFNTCKLICSVFNLPRHDSITFTCNKKKNWFPWISKSPSVNACKLKGKKWNGGKHFPAYCSKIYCTSLGVKYGLFLSPVFGVGIFSFQSEDILYSFWR